MTEVKDELAATGDYEGEHECEVWAEGSEGADELKGCQKNPSHVGFITVKEFSLQHLPEPYREKTVLQAIQLMSELTVRLRVKYTSKARPDKYIFSEKRGKNIVHTGSGLVYSDPLLITDEQCPCPKCCLSSKPKREWWKVLIQTARHVVYNEEEAVNTVVDVFYDDDNKYGMKSMFGFDVAKSVDINREDSFHIVCATHDEALGQSLLLASKHFQILSVKLFRKFCFPKKYPWCSIIVSHPHGCSKRITVGEGNEKHFYFNDLEEQMSNISIEEWSRYSYSTPTCRGSSGAPNFILGRGTETGKQYINLTYTHSGVRSVASC